MKTERGSTRRGLTAFDGLGAGGPGSSAPGSGVAAGAGGPGKKRRWGPLLHGVLLALAFVIFALPVALPAGVVTGALGAALGTLLAERLCAARYRLPVIVLGASAFTLLAAAAGRVVTGSALVSGLLGPENALALADMLRFGGLAAGLSVVLRAAAIRFRAALAIEGSLVVAAVAATVSAHRDGMIARPLDVSDWFWSQGVDPVIAFLAIGLVGALLLAGVLAYGRSLGRTIAQLLVVLVLGIFFAAQIHSRDPSQQRDVLGMSSDDKKKQDEERERDKRPSGGGQGEGSRQQSAGGTPFDSDGMYKDPTNSPPPPQNRPAAIVVFHKGVTPGNGAFYFRHAAFSQFNGSRLVEATVGGVDRDARHQFPLSKVEIPGVEHHAEGRELVATDIALLTDHQRMFLLIDGMEAEPMPNPDPARFRRAYRTVSTVVTAGYDELLGHSPGSESWSDEVWSHYTTLPKDERYHALAAELQGSLRSDYQSDPLALALAVKQYLEETSTYSFARQYEGDDPTAQFLFSEDKKGYCVHLAHAAAYLLRAVGVPARVSAGYMVPAANLGGGSSLLIKSGDAHAWAEIYLGGMGWVPIEVTPEKTDVEPAQFNERDLQSLLGEMARKEGRNEREQQQQTKVVDIFKAALEALPWVLLGLLIFSYGVKLWRLIAPVIAARRHQPLVAYRAALDRLAGVGLVRARGESRERFAGRASAVAPSFTPLTSVHVGAALGSKQVRDPAVKPVELTSGVAREVRRSVPLWRWILGALNPISWLWSR